MVPGAGQHPNAGSLPLQFDNGRRGEATSSQIKGPGGWEKIRAFRILLLQAQDTGRGPEGLQGTECVSGGILGYPGHLPESSTHHPNDDDEDAPEKARSADATLIVVVGE